MQSKESVDFRYVTKDESRDFHSRRRWLVIYRNELHFIEKGSSMSHFEFCSRKLKLSKDEFNKLTRGYFLDGDLVFYKDNFIYDENVIKEGLAYAGQIKKTLNIAEAKIYFGLIVKESSSNWPFDLYYGDSLASGEIVKKC